MSPATLAMIGRRLALRGEVAFLIDDGGLIPAVDWEVTTRNAGPRAYRLSAARRLNSLAIWPGGQFRQREPSSGNCMIAHSQPIGGPWVSAAHCHRLCADCAVLFRLHCSVLSGLGRRKVYVTCNARCLRGAVNTPCDQERDRNASS